MTFWGRKKKKGKEKRNGLPGQRTRATSGLTVLIILFFLVMWFLLVSPPKPPLPITPTVIQTSVPPAGTPSQMLTRVPLTRTDPLGISQVWVPAGCFKMGSDPTKDSQAQSDEEPAHDVCITKGYWLDVYDVTNAAFDAFVKVGGYTTDGYWSADGLKWKQSGSISGPNTSCSQYSSDSQQPRVCVNWYEAEAYANWRTTTATDGTLYRLPTEAEWEYAARGPESPIYPWGNTFDKSKANTIEAGPGKTTTVGSYPAGASWVGAQDMVGNVFQWVADWSDANYYGNAPKNDPTGPTSGQSRVLRGGSWDNNQRGARSAYRNDYDPGGQFSVVGFRVVGVVPS